MWSLAQGFSLRLSIPTLRGVSELRKRRLSTIIKTCRARFSPILEGEHETLARGTKTIAGPLLEVQEAGGSSGLPFHAVCYPGNQDLASTVGCRELAQTPTASQTLQWWLKLFTMDHTGHKWVTSSMVFPPLACSC